MHKKIISALLLICILTGLFAVELPAHAASITVYVKKNLLKVYKKPSTSSTCLGTMCYGESMTGIAASGDWAMVQNPAGAVGYCKLSGLTDANPNNLNTPAYIVVQDAPIYRKPSTGSGVMGYLEYGSCYTCVAATPDGAWIRLKNGKYYGYLPRELAAHTRPSGSEIDPGSGSSQVIGVVYVAANILTGYDGPDAGARPLGTLPYGEALHALSVDGEWVHTQTAAGLTAWCPISGLTPDDPNTLSQRVTVTASSLNVRSQPISSAPSLGKIKKGATCTCVAITPDGAWARLQNGSMYGYASTEYLSGLKSPTDLETTAYVADTFAAVYASPSENAAIYTEIAFGESVTCIAFEGDWVTVVNPSGNIGYCKKSALSSTNTNIYHEYAYALRSGVALRALPRTDADVLLKLNQNDAVVYTALSPDQAWARVYYGSILGYVSTADLSKIEADDGSDIEDVPPQTVFAAAATLACYSAPSLSSTQVAVAGYGSSCTLTGVGKTWARLENDSGKTAYCKLSGLTMEDPNTYNVTLYAQHDGAPVYALPVAAASVIAEASRNATTTAVAVTPDAQWARVTSNGVDFGYVSRSDFGIDPSSDPQSDSKLEAVIALAEKQMDKPYVYGADGTDSYDCSGLTYYCFKNAAGITLQRTAYQQGYDDKYPKITSISALQRGDLVFFNTVDTDDDLCDHVGIYLGGNKFIHASSGAGKVTVSSLPANDSSSYYTRTFAWGRRVFK